MHEYVDPKVASAREAARSREEAARINSGSRERSTAIQAEIRELAIREQSTLAAQKAESDKRIAELNGENALALRRLEHDLNPEEARLAHQLRITEHRETSTLDGLLRVLETRAADRSRDKSVTHATNEQIRLEEERMNIQNRRDLFIFYLDKCRNAGVNPSENEFEAWLEQLADSEGFSL